MTEASVEMSQGNTAHGDEQAAKLLRMAEQIAGFFRSYPEEEAVRSVADHVNQFWSSRMREDFLAFFSNDSNELSPLLRKARGSIKAKTSRD